VARLGRYFLPDQPLHVIQRGNNRGAVFFGEDDDAQYGGWLAEVADGYGCRIHAYVFMTNHVHLLVTPERQDSLPRTMQSLRRRYVRTSTRRIAVPERSGRGAAGPRRSTARLISSRAVAMSN
jgi:putative transposase